MPQADPAPLDPSQASAPATGRRPGFDVAVGAAVAGVVASGFQAAMLSAARGPEWLRSAVVALDGRGAAMLFVLAGVGLSWRTAGAAGRSGGAIGAMRRRVLGGAAVLAVLGYVLAFRFAAEVLHPLAACLAVGALLIGVSDRALWLWAAASAALFAGLYSFAGYWDQLEPAAFTYHGPWSPVGLVRGLLFNGWYPVLPWATLAIAGMWLGRRDLRRAAVRWAVAGGGALAAVAGEVIGALHPIAFDVVAKSSDRLGLEAGAGALLASNPLPPGPVFLLAAGGAAVVAIVACLEVGLRWPDAPAIRWVGALGRMPVTIYAAAIAVGMSVLDLSGHLGSEPLWFALASAAGFAVVAAAFAVLWLGRFPDGPIEALLRRSWAGRGPVSPAPPGAPGRRGW